MQDEHALKMLNTAGRKVERERKWRLRLSTKARKIVNALSTENARLKAALLSYVREDE